eukprot:gnl/TRDRNA2_/TRDRNA2_156415_c0_seq1.p1 gnl/TRDRNA2_/TRDRNA2_156415_c0~~gnl/TRDRNA2_/TRDRNA2_156415_c0_seq1.p1  ORF type:complete len:535 (-),score=73.84 gnl/TRDRNA2_/TRDRNA2_156415_c0_seq1:73-1632(-)
MVDTRTQGPFNVSDLDVVVADDEDICRFAAVNNLEKFGFLRNKVHEVENGEEVLAKVKELERGAAPIIVILSSRLNDCARALYERGSVYLVLASAKRLADLDGAVCHCSVPKTFTQACLNDVFTQCVNWWTSGQGATTRNWTASSVQHPPASPSPTSTMPQPHAQPQRQWTANSTRIEPPKPELSPALPRYEPPPRAEPETPSAKADAVVDPEDIQRGNSLASLTALLPARPPFEDVEMVCLAGRGSFGRVYRARWHASPVALKVVDQCDEGKPGSMAFEGALSASLAHPNLVQTFKFSVRETKGQSQSADSLRMYEVWIVQEWCSLGTLHQRISKGKSLKDGYQEVIECCTEIASAFAYLHDRGIIHGDLTAGNVLLAEKKCSKGYITKVSDFGLARVLVNGASGINTATMGTVTYMPPELFQLEGCALTKKVDVYAFGIITWLLCTRRLPFDGLQPAQVVVMVAQGATLNLPEEVPTALGNLYKSTVARTPEQRPGFDRIVQELLIMADLKPALSSN